ncbi:hypothetical protein Tco_0932681 [Tanacetum coccineum]
MFLATIADIQALLGSSDDELKEDSDDDVFEAGEEMDEDIQEPDTEETQTHHSTETPTKEPHSQEHQSPSPPKEQHESSKAKKTNASDSRSSCSKTFRSYGNYMTITERQLHEEVVASYADLRAAIEGYYEDVDHIAQTDKLVFDTLEANSALKAAIQQMAKSNDLARLLRNAKLTELLTHVTMQDDIVFIKGMVTKMFQDFKGISTSTPSGSASFPTVTQPEGEKISSKETTKEAEIKHVEKESEVEDVVMELVQEPQIHGKMYQLTDEEIPAHVDKEEKIEQAAKEALLSKPELIKVVHEEATKAGVDRKILASAKGGQEFRKIQDAKIKATRIRLKLETIIDIHFYPNIKLVIVTVFRGNNQRNFDVFNPFKFGDFKVIKLDELDPIIQKKKNKVVGDLMTSLGKRLECNRSLPKGISFVNNLMIKQSEYEIFFIDVFGDKAFQRMSDIHKVDIETLLTYLVMASNISTLSNQKFCLALRRLIESHPHQEKLKSKKVNLESVGYKLD